MATSRSWRQLSQIELDVRLRAWDPTLEPPHLGQLPYRAQEPLVGLLLPAQIEPEEGVRKLQSGLKAK
jgi:hypothetical protein